MSKRKTSALRNQQSKSTRRNSDNNVFYINENSNIADLNSPYSKKVKKSIELIPQSINQEKYIVALTDPNIDIVVVSGPAGTGKTYLAMLAAIQAMKRGHCDKILLTRPAVTVDDEKHGFLPGDLNSKMEPWVKPLFDVLKEYYSSKELEYMLNEEIIEIAPLAYCRGRTFKNAWIILDETQNCSISQCKMILTRIGENSKLIITGDVEQTDKKKADNGLMDLVYRIQHNPSEKIQFCGFTEKDVRRHPLIPHILSMYR